MRVFNCQTLYIQTVSFSFKIYHQIIQEPLCNRIIYHTSQSMASIAFCLPARSLALYDIAVHRLISLHFCFLQTPLTVTPLPSGVHRIRGDIEAANAAYSISHKAMFSAENRLHCSSTKTLKVLLSFLL